MRNHSVINIIASVLLVGLLAGCAVGPDFKRPASPAVATYTTSPLPDFTASAPTKIGGSQRFITGDGGNSQWWQEFGSAKLNILIAEALQASPTLAGAQATLRQAQEVYSGQAGLTRYPQVDAGLTGQQQRFNPNSSGLPGDARDFDLYNAGVGVRYKFDLAGGNRRALEALEARSDYQRYQLDGARLTLVSNIVTTAISQARLWEQIQISQTILRAQEEQLELTRERLRLGQVASSEVLVLQTEVEQTRAGIPLLLNQLQQSQHLLAVLVGQPPSARSLPSFSLQEFTLPVELPLIVPSELVRTRPDIQAAEALLQAANAEYGVAVANLYPQLNLSASLGSQALTTGALFGSGSAVWSLIGQLTQPLFNPGLPAEKRAALAVFDAAAAHYQVVVLDSLRNVADVLRALENDAQRLSALSSADTAAQGSLELMQRQYRLGAASYMQLLIAQQQAQRTQIPLIESKAQRLINSAVFYQAMGSDINAGLSAASLIKR
ncbi:MAG: efflux transporter outer membrane subunit [Alcanivoracaceae bacterium]|jgi:NodT family efflux transporter outer membrane factor (OMF) lipoprotein|nr:efflux transporter outer membrane subunit [Alcanivoracaceae bacterium]